MIQDFIQSQDKMKEKDGMLKVEKWMVPKPYYVQIDTSLKQVVQMLLEMDVEYISVVSKEMNPVGIVTAKLLLTNLLQGSDKDQPLLNGIGNNILNEDLSIVHTNDSLTEICALPYKYFQVVDNQNKLVGILTRNEILNGLSWYINRLNQEEHTAEVLNVILDSAYEGITVVDEEGMIIEFNDAYSRFIGVEKKDAIGRNVQEVIDNTNLHNTILTGMPERGEIQYIQGQAMIVHRIPIWKNNRVIGAIGMVIFEGVTELYNIYKKLQKNTGTNKIIQHPSIEKVSETSKVTLDQIIGVSKSTSKIKRMARKVAKTSATVLITGESGTGKEMFAQSIHHLSPFSTGHFISVNCGAIPEHLFESELFGYEEGAFTGAKKGGKSGKFELAQNGTLFLDEIGEMPLLMQTKLLRVLQEKEFERVGGIQKYKLNVRIIAATNQNLKKMVEAGNFREDLFYRINVIELPIPPLRGRMEDIPPLISYYLNAICSKYQIPVKELTPEAMSTFINYDWHGNVRELVNVIEKLIVLVESEKIELKHIPDYMINKDLNSQSDRSSNENTNILHYVKSQEKEKEKEIILTVLQRNKGNKSKAAKELGIHRTTLYQKLKKYDFI